MAGQKKPNPKQFDKNPVEIVGEAVFNRASDEVKSLADVAWEQLGLKPRKPNQALSGELAVSQQVQTLEKKTEAAEAKVDALEKQLFNTVKTEGRELLNTKKEAEAQRIKELVTELAKEVASVKSQTAALTGEVKNIAVETVTEGPQTYHLNFFEWILSMLREIKKDIVKSRTWLSAFNNKKAKKGYWAMFKKHGLKFAASDERALAQAAG